MGAGTRLARILLMTLAAVAMAAAQDQLRTTLFGEVDLLRAQAKERQAELLAPGSYAKGMEYYSSANEAFQKARSLEDIRERLKNASAYFSKALDLSKLAEATFSTALSARKDAMSADAPSSYPQAWKKAEEELLDAASELEKGDVEDARQFASGAEATYRNAELEAIKANFLAPARALIQRAEASDVGSAAPKTLARAKHLAAQVENLLSQNRYDTDEARDLAMDARYEAAHAITLAVAINKLTTEDRTFEDVLLASEELIRRAAAAVGVQARFDNGMENPVNEIASTVRERDEQQQKNVGLLAASAESLRVKELEIENLKKQTASMESRLGTLNETERTLQQQLSDQYKLLATQRQQEETIRQVAGMFTTEEGSVFREGDKVVIRLYGLTFPVGKNMIDPQLYPLLAKVQDAIRRFPNCRVNIEGHTDSQGSDETNQTLSASRAKAVAEYFMANMNAELEINHEGYGESRPVASNDSPEGRARNRRIDVVITPGWTTVGK